MSTTAIFPERIPPLPIEDFTPEQAQLTGDWKHLAFSRVLIRAPRMYRTFVNGWLTELIAHTKLPPHDRQVICLRMLELCGDVYEITHHFTISRNTGLSDEQIETYRFGKGPMSAFDRTLVDAIEQLHGQQNISDAVWAALSERYDEEQLMELVYLAGCYLTMGMLTKSFGMQLESADGEFDSINKLRSYK